MTQIDHLGIAVRSLAQAKEFYEKLGLNVLPEEIVEAERVRLAMVPVGESRIELLEPTSADSKNAAKDCIMWHCTSPTSLARLSA